MDIITQGKKELSLESHISRSLLNHLYEGIYFVDLNRQIQFWNKGAENITGYTKDEVIMKSCLEGILCHQNETGEILCQGRCPLTTAIEEDCHIDERVYLKHKDGRMIPVLVHVSPIKNNNGKIIGAVEVFNDDTAYENLKIANKKLEELNELKNQFLGMAAHDLRNPLTVAMSFSAFLLEFHKHTLEETHLKFIQKINDACKAMLLLINDLLDITSIEAGKIKIVKKPCKIENILNLENFSMKIMADHKNIDIQVEIEPGIPEIEVDINRINQVMENLISNAVKFSYPNSTIKLIARADENFVMIIVSDQGQGIPADEITKLFQPFQKTSIKPTAKESSTGLGLLIVKKIIEMHEGTIEVESELHKGSSFIIKFPISN